MELLFDVAIALLVGIVVYLLCAFLTVPKNYSRWIALLAAVITFLVQLNTVTVGL